MKKLLNYFLTLLVLMSMTACSMSIEQKKESEFRFSFSNARTVVGTKISIDVMDTKSNIIISHVDETIKTEQKYFNKSIADIPIGTNVKVLVTLLSPEGKKISSGESVAFDVQKGVNTVPTIILESVQIPVNIVIGKGIKFSNYVDPITTTNPTLELSIDGKAYSPTPIDLSKYISNQNGVELKLGNRSLNQPIAINAKIKNGNKIYYETSQSITPLSSSPIDVVLTPNNGYLLYKISASPNSSVALCYEDILEATEDPLVDLPFGSNTKLLDAAMDSYGNMLAIHNNYEPRIDFYPHGYIYNPEIPDGLISYDKSTIINYPQDASLEMLAIDSYKKSDFIISMNDSVGDTTDFYKLSNRTESNIMATKFTTTLPIEYQNSELQDFTVSGDNIYVTTLLRGEAAKTIKILKGTISETEIIFDNNSLVFDLTAYQENNETIFAYDFAVSDMKVIDGKLYLLVLDIGRGPMYNNKDSINPDYPPTLVSHNNSRGAFVSIDLSKDLSDSSRVKVIGLHQKRLNSTEPNQDIRTPAAGNYIYMLQTSDTSSINSNFLGPRKFIAVKPKKLVIADAGATGNDPTTREKSLLKRIIEVDLDTLTLKIKDVDSEFFGGKVSIDCGYCYSIEP